MRELSGQWNTDTAPIGSIQGYLLDHGYDETTLRFTDLEDRDKEIVEALRATCDANGEPMFVVCLVLLT